MPYSGVLTTAIEATFTLAFAAVSPSSKVVSAWAVDLANYDSQAARTITKASKAGSLCQ